MDLNLKGKIALVAGATGDIGKAIVQALALEHADLVLCSRREDMLNGLVRDIESIADGTVIPVPADLSKSKDAKDLVRRVIGIFGKIDILINSFAAPFWGFNLSEIMEVGHRCKYLVTRTIQKLFPHDLTT
jgi:3-oxoacyl-[acyl-carrier protein] reductase